MATNLERALFLEVADGRQTVADVARLLKTPENTMSTPLLRILVDPATKFFCNRSPYFPHISLLKSRPFFSGLLFSSVLDFADTEQLDDLTL